MSEDNNEKTTLAELYDRHSSEFYDYHAKRDDVEFYVGFAQEAGGKILELGCGTGRVLIPTARAGVKVTGIDLSGEMLDICRKKLNEEPVSVRYRVTLIQADMADFNLNNRFPLVTITYGPFNCLLTSEKQLSCLKCINNHLEDGGGLLFDVWYADAEELQIPENTELFHTKKPFELPDGREVTWGITYSSIDHQRQIINEKLTYIVTHPDGRVEKLVYPETIRYFYPKEVEHLLARTGFKTDSIFGSFEKEPFKPTDKSEMIFYARKV